jgi:hypothetical protein
MSPFMSRIGSPPSSQILVDDAKTLLADSLGFHLVDDLAMGHEVAIYCGVPAAVDSFRIAREAFTEFDKEK